MFPDLERLVRLQHIETAADHARRRLDTLPLESQALDARINDKQRIVDEAKGLLATSQQARRDIEKDLGVVQARLSKFKDQLMEVKTNKEYQAMQKEIATAEREVRSFEDRILERMEEGEALQGEVKRAEGGLKQEQVEVAKARQELDAERVRTETDVERLRGERSAVVAELSAPAFALFEHIARSRRVAVVEARDGHCSFCHVRLRPQIFNEVRRNAALIQCESCQRILYFAGAPAVAQPETTIPETLK